MNWTYEQIVCKYTKHLILSEVEGLRGYLPNTDWFGKNNLKRFLRLYKVVYVKPSRGTGGRGIFKVEKKKENGKWIYSYHFKREEKTFPDFLTLYKALRKKIKRVNKENRNYLVQQGIHLLKQKDSLFDVRAFVQLNPETGQFECLGLMVRVGDPNKIVTNISNSGQPKAFGEVFQTITSEEETIRLKAELEQISTKMAAVIKSQYTGIVQLGFDFGIDENLKPWLIEVNIKPKYNGFRKIDMDLFEKIDLRAKQLTKEA